VAELSDENSAKLDIPTPHPINLEFFAKRGNKTTKLINSDEAFALEGTHRWFEYEFAEPVYLSSLRIDCSGYEGWHKFEIEVFHSDQTQYHDYISVDNDSVSLNLGKLVVGFRFKPESRWMTKTSILNVVVTGYSLADFGR
jgi:hypothetical protein